MLVRGWRFRFAVVVSLGSLWAAPVVAQPAPCQSVSFEGNSYTVCEIDLRRQVIRLFWKRADGSLYGYLRALPQTGLVAAMNAGMFDPSYRPVGLYVEQGRELVRVNTKPGPGNFHLRPNGVFYVASGMAGVLETGAYLKQQLQPEIATQSGPLLVIHGRLHPRFIRYGASRKRRSGVGVRDPSTVFLALSNGEVLFEEFGRLFRDRLKCENALFLDGGSEPSLYVPGKSSGNVLLPLGPMIGVFERSK
jgi:uncharacterized protein YigE (DUF2233 family)